jgi:hypothetical protein
MSIVCKSWYRFAFDNVLWKQVCRERWSAYGPLDVGIPDLHSFKPKVQAPPLESNFLTADKKNTQMPPFMTEEGKK